MCFLYGERERERVCYVAVIGEVGRQVLRGYLAYSQSILVINDNNDLRYIKVT